MRCEKFREKIILYLYGELGKKSSEELKNHIKNCPECAKELEYTQKLFELVEETQIEDIPEADWEKCWSHINEKISVPEKKTKRHFWHFPKWAYTTAALVCVLIIGIIIGRTAFTPGFKANPMAGETIGAFYLSLQEHFADLKPLLTEYAHYREDEGKGTVTLDRKVAEDLLIQNILLKRLAADKNPSARQLLEDIELVLREMTNMGENGTATPLKIKEYINN
ncbi:MAG TPA: zf-HC2 domain-containing protein, partial [Acidobacteriota bacterium]|nr:zf-HC2 domain-containing protein [Acidobacteriota bacterium]